MTKNIAFYLPQFHEIPENNEWWGKGFTEWTNVKKSKPLFKGHHQPRVPFESNYYDLNEVSVMESQAKLAKKHGIDGFCFYHYYFEDGKTLLEQPLKNFLNSKIDIDYCFCWANESWTRNWDGKSRQVLIKQDYGIEDDWKNHFEYMIQYFMDSRYIKHGNKPVFLIYKAEDIPNFNEFTCFWNKLAKENGFEGVEFIVVQRQFNAAFIDDFVDVNYKVSFEPFYSLSSTNSLSKYYKFGGGIARNLAVKTYDLLSQTACKFGLREHLAIDYQSIIKKSIHNSRNSSADMLPGCFVDWDNSPRRGEKGIIFKGFNVELFEEYISATIYNAKSTNKPFVFINAWNEWAEGTYLEPDEKYGYSVLESFASAVENNTEN